MSNRLEILGNMATAIHRCASRSMQLYILKGVEIGCNTLYFFKMTVKIFIIAHKFLETYYSLIERVCLLTS